MSNTTRINVGIIGSGGMANTHAEAFQKIRGVKLLACQDIVPGRSQEFARTHNIKHAFSDTEQILEICDAVAIVTPDKFHAPICLQAINARKHILCEKPLTLTLKEARTVARAASQANENHGLIHMVNFSYRDHAVFGAAEKLVKDGKLGYLRHVHGAYLQHWLAADTWGHWSHEVLLWRLQQQSGSGGVLGDVGCHILDFITGIAGDAKALRCTKRTFPKILDGQPVTHHHGKLNVNDSALIEIDFANGALGLAHVTRWATGHTNHILFEAHGTEGALRIDLDEGGLILHTCLGNHRHIPTWKTMKVRPIPNMWQRFIQSIKTGINDEPSFIRGAQIQAYLDACERSSEQNGAPMKIRKWV